MERIGFCGLGTMGSAMAGNLSGFEEATRALFAGDAAKFASLIAAWPQAVAAYTKKLATDGFTSAPRN